MAINPPYWPPDDPATEAAIGRFILTWNALEREIDAAAHELMMVNVGTALKVTSNLNFRPKLHMVHALFEDFRGEDLVHGAKPELGKRIDDLISATSKANDDLRSAIVHGQAIPLHIEDDIHPFHMKWSAKKGGVKAHGTVYSPSSVQADTDTVKALVIRWNSLRVEISPALAGFAMADADTLLHGGPDQEDHLLLQTQSIPDCPAPKVKQPRTRPTWNPPKDPR